MIGKLCADSRKATNIHFGGGSPTMLSAVDFSRLMSCVRDVFNVSKDAEIAIEIDPRQMSEAKAASYAKAGVTRASLGVQDFDQKVLQAVNRAQPFHASYETVTVLREYEINKINLDLIYGLPHQTTKTIKKTAEYALLLKPDRIALFGYAHVPWMKKHMRLIPAQALPDALTRLELFEAASEIFCAAGYVPIGIDHFAKPDDPLAEAKASRNLHRNFQGYTDDQCDALIGFGVSAISRLPAGFVQNSPQMSSYRAAILDRNPPVAKFSPLSDEDKLRGDIIQSLMCNFQADIASICRKHGYAADYFKNEVGTLKTLRDSGLINLDDSGTINILAPQAARFACAAFDAYLQPAEIARHVTAT